MKSHIMRDLIDDKLCHMKVSDIVDYLLTIFCIFISMETNLSPCIIGLIIEFAQLLFSCWEEVQTK